MPGLAFGEFASCSFALIRQFPFNGLWLIHTEGCLFILWKHCCKAKKNINLEFWKILFVNHQNRLYVETMNEFEGITGYPDGVGLSIKQFATCTLEYSILIGGEVSSGKPIDH